MKTETGSSVEWGIGHIADGILGSMIRLRFFFAIPLVFFQTKITVKHVVLLLSSGHRNAKR